MTLNNFKVTACLITWKRPGNIELIKKKLSEYEFIDEILVRDHEEVENLMNHGRYVLADEAKNGSIYLQDDDLLIRNIDDIYKAFIENPNKLINGGPKEYLDVAKKENIYGDAQMAIVGWGSMISKQHIPLLNKYTDKYGKDYCFYRETDRILSMLMNQHHVMVKTELDILDGANSKHAHCQQKNHIKYKELAINRCLKLLKG